MKSAIVTASAWRRVASKVASLTKFARSAPVKPGVNAAICSGSRRRRALRLFQVHRQNFLTAPFVRPIDQHLAVEPPGPQQRGIEDFGPVGRGEQAPDRSMDRSRRARPRAGSRSDPSRRARLRRNAPRARPSASSSSMKMIAGACWRACSNRSRTRAAPTPTNISTNSEPEIEKNGTPASPATARASKSCRYPAGRPAARPWAGGRRAGHTSGVLQEIDDLDQFVLGFVDTGNIGEGDLGLLLHITLARLLPICISPPTRLAPCAGSRTSRSRQKRSPAGSRTGYRAANGSRPPRYR